MWSVITKRKIVSSPTQGTPAREDNEKRPTRI